MPATSADAYAAAVDLIHDPRPMWGGVPAHDTHRIRTILSSLVADIDRLRIRLALTPGEAGRLDAARAEEFECRVERVIELHRRISDPRGAVAEVCGVCAAGWPCDTVRAAQGVS